MRDTHADATWCLAAGVLAVALTVLAVLRFL